MLPLISDKGSERQNQCIKDRQDWMLEEISGRTLSDCIRRQGSDMLSISNACCANSISIKGDMGSITC